MSIDATDYEPRPADDLISANVPAIALGFIAANTISEKDKPRFTSILKGNFKPKICHQLGCNFNELPHG
jgi:hypothetical protein